MSWALRGTTTNINSEIALTVNGTTTNFINQVLQSTGSSASTYPSNFDTTSVFVNGDQAASNSYGYLEIYLPMYTYNGLQKCYISTGTQISNTTTTFVTAGAHRRSATASINSFAFRLASGASFMAGSTFHLYGIKYT